MFEALFICVLVSAILDYIQRRVLFGLDYEKQSKVIFEKNKSVVDKLMLGGLVLQAVVCGLVAYQQKVEENESAESKIKLIKSESRLSEVQKELNELRDMARVNPSVPLVSLVTQGGLPYPWPFGKEVGPKEQEMFRYHLLQIENTNKVNLNSVSVEMLLPEPVIHFYETQSTAGVSVSVKRPPRGAFQAIPNGGSVGQVGERLDLPVRQWWIDSDLIPAGGFVRIYFLTVRHPLVSRVSDPRGLNVGLQGSFKFTSNNRVETILFDSSFGFDRTNRAILLGPAKIVDTHWIVHEVDF
jgi:hypothetical protein